MTDDAESAPEHERKRDLEADEPETDLENDEPIDLETVETRLKAADRHLQALFEASEDVDAPGARRRLAETRRELLTIRHEFTAAYTSNDDHAGHDIPPIVARGGAGRWRPSSVLVRSPSNGSSGRNPTSRNVTPLFSTENIASLELGKCQRGPHLDP